MGLRTGPRPPRSPSVANRPTQPEIRSVVVISRVGVTDLTFPVLAFSKYGLLVNSSAEMLGTEFKTTFEAGVFVDLLMVDSSGRTFRVVDTKVLGGAGALWGYSLFYPRRLRIELVLELAKDQLTLEEVRSRVLKEFRDWHGWETRDDFDELREGVTRAESIREVAEIFATPG